VTVLITLIIMRLLGESFNLMTLGGLAAAVGLVIDDAIVVVENIVLHRDAGQPRLQAIHCALQEITVPLLGSTITPIVVFLPLIAIAGVTGTFFRALAVTVTVSLLTSLVLALSWTPTLSQYFISSKPRFGGKASADGEITTEQLLAAEEASLTGMFGKVVEFYERVLKTALSKPKLIAILSLVLVVCAYFAYRGLGSDLLPEMDEGGFILDYLMPAGTSLQETDRVLQHIDEMLHAIPEVETTSRRTGLQLGLAAVTEANSGDFTVKLKQKRSRSVDEVMEDVRAQIHEEEPVLDVELLQL
jgi:multidrug efflux pump subunit AcrB